MPTRRVLSAWLFFAIALSLPLDDPSAGAAEADRALNDVFSCRNDNDLYQVARANGVECRRYSTPAEAVRAAAEGDGVLILADAYPHATTAVGAETYETATRKRLRLYVEVPSLVPGMTVGPLRRTSLERVVAVSDRFGPSLKPMQILAVHDCHFVEVRAERPHLVLAKVAGFDTAAYGLSDTKTFPVLFEHPRGDVLVATTKLSQFVTARYATKEAMQAVWRFIFAWLRPGTQPPGLDWTPAVRPSYAREARLPPDAARRAIQRGIDWHAKARMLLSEAGWQQYQRLRVLGKVNASDPVASRPEETLPVGDGRFGVLEGFSSRIGFDGTQPVRWWLRTDCNGETSLAFALRWKLDGHEPSRAVAANLLDWVYLTSGLLQNDPAKANFGLLMTMAAYPGGWRWTNGIQQERGRMLLTLAWLVRVDDGPEHRAWLKRMADDMERWQDACGAIREELGELEQGDLRPPRSNAEYGTNEASLIQKNGDPVADLLYTCNFTLLGLHEAHAATGDPQYRRMADKLAEFLVRVQVRSEAHPELDGGWFRAFDFRQWDYWGSNADSGWGAWSIEVGWTQAWIPAVLALRGLNVSLWDLSKGSRVGRHFEKYRRLMLETATYAPPPANRPKG